MKNFYYTFGSDDGFPFKNGWVVVKANTQDEAHDIFSDNFPDRHDHVLNCAFYYNENQWKIMNPEKYWIGYKYYGTWDKSGKIE